MILEILLQSILTLNHPPTLKNIRNESSRIVELRRRFSFDDKFCRHGHFFHYIVQYKAPRFKNLGRHFDIRMETVSCVAIDFVYCCFWIVIVVVVADSLRIRLRPGARFLGPS